MTYAALSKQLDHVARDLAAIRAPLLATVDPLSFAHSVGFKPDDWQADVLAWRGLRLLMNCHRQAGKSTVAAMLAAWQSIYVPHSLVLLISPSLRQSSELFLKVSDILHKAAERPALDIDNKLSCRLMNGSRIVSLPSSEATVRGFSGASLIIEDEAARVSDELYYAMRPMLAVSGGRLILLSTPFGKRGHFFEAWGNGGEAWERVEVTADECPRITAEFLAEERRAISERWYRQEFFCEFVETSDQVFSYDTIMSAISPEVQPLFAGV